MNKIIITIDGPCGAGKTSTAKALAKKLNIAYLDTGGMYRALAYAFIKSNFDYEHASSNKRHAIASDLYGLRLRMRYDSTKLKPHVDGMRYDNGQLRFYMDGTEITPDIRTEQISDLASKISVYPEIREVINRAARAFAIDQSIVAEGRDTGTALFPNATVRFYLNPCQECRAKRRMLDANSDFTDMESVLKAIQIRDHRDMTRQNDPLPNKSDAKKKGLLVINNESMTLDDTVNFLYDKIVNKIGELW